MDRPTPPWVSRRRFTASVVGLGSIAASGCIGGDAEPSGDPEVNETITEETSWTFTLEAGDRVRLIAEDNTGDEVMTVRFQPAEGRGINQSKTTLNERWEVTHPGEYEIAIEPNSETHVRIWIEGRN